MTPEQALRVARFLWPGKPWRQVPRLALEPNRPHIDALLDDGGMLWWYGDNLSDLAAAERALVERGLGEQYGRELATLLRTPESTYGRTWSTSGEHIAAIRTAPLDVIARAILRTIEAAEAGPEDA